MVEFSTLRVNNHRLCANRRPFDLTLMVMLTKEVSMLRFYTDVGKKVENFRSV